LTVLEAGTVSAAFLVAVFLSNLPEAIAATSGLSKAGWAASRILGLWIGVMVVSGLSALAGYGLLDTATPRTIALVLAFAGGAIMPCRAARFRPGALEQGASPVALSTPCGSARAFAIGARD